MQPPAELRRFCASWQSVTAVYGDETLCSPCTPRLASERMKIRYPLVCTKLAAIDGVKISYKRHDCSLAVYNRAIRIGGTTGSESEGCIHFLSEEETLEMNEHIQMPAGFAPKRRATVRGE